MGRITKAIPSKKQLNMGIITDKGINSSAIKKDETN